MTKDNLVLIHHILDSITHMESYLAKIDSDENTFSINRHWQSAFIRELSIIGEAANKIDQRFIDQHPSIPWDKIIKMRHKLIHDYFEINLPIVWETITLDIPPIKPLLEQLIK